MEPKVGEIIKEIPSQDTNIRLQQLSVLRIKNEKKNILTAFENKTFDKSKIEIEFVSEMQWRIGFRGKEGTIWEGGLYCCTVDFPNNYPASPPQVVFDDDFEHIHIYQNNGVCLDLLNKDLTYKPTTTMNIIIAELYRLIYDKPNTKSPANSDLNKLYMESIDKYNQKIQDTAAKLKDKTLITKKL